MKRQPPMIIDIETVDASDEDLLLEAELLKPAANIKDIGKKEKNLKDKNASLLTKKALLDSSPIHCVGIKLGQAMISLSLCRPTAAELKVLGEAGIKCISFGDEEALLNGVAALFRAVTPECLVTFNGKNFDLPKIRFRMSRFGIKIPETLSIMNIDLMIMYSNLFTLSKVPYVSMNEVLCKLHIARKPINGEAYGRFVGEKDYVSAIIYNMIDCLLTEQIYRRLV